MFPWRIVRHNQMVHVLHCGFFTASYLLFFMLFCTPLIFHRVNIMWICVPWKIWFNGTIHVLIWAVDWGSLLLLERNDTLVGINQRGFLIYLPHQIDIKLTSYLPVASRASDLLDRHCSSIKTRGWSRFKNSSCSWREPPFHEDGWFQLCSRAKTRTIKDPKSPSWGHCFWQV